MLRHTSRFALVLTCLVLAIPIAFSQAVSFTTFSSPYFDSLHADFNSDGREDFISSIGCSNSSFGLALSTGDGTYAPPVCYTLPHGAQAYYFAIGDFNGDGNADLIISNDTNTFYEYFGSRSGTLRFYKSFTAPTAVTTLAAADVNHDGKIDLLFDGGDNNLWVWFGNGDGTFTPGPATSMGIGGYLFVGDFDGDGKADIVSENGDEGGTDYQVFYGDGTGHFQASKVWVDDVDYAVYDLNGDGRSDLVGQPFDFSINGNTYYNKVRVLYGHANRIFTEREITTANCDAWGFPPAIADFNGDGINDIAAVEASDCKGDGPDTFNVLLGNGNGTYQHEQVIYTGSSTELLIGTSVMRANRDSKPDLVLSEDYGDGSNLLFQNTTIGNFPACDAPTGYTGITLCAPTTTVVGSSPVQFSIGAANQTPGRKVEVWVDGKKMSEQLKGAFSYYSFLDATYQLSNGTHSVTVFSAGWDNLLQQFTFPLTVGSTTCASPSSPGVNVCSPLDHATVDSPVLAWASGTVTGTIARMEVWVDGVKKYTTYGKNTLKTNISLASGTHTFVYYIVNTAGQKWKQTVYGTVP
jgi:FG-GAP-like repeat